jgi:beta-galactosidase/beta-glucuronidase
MQQQQPEKRKKSKAKYQQQRPSFDPHRVDPAKSNQIRYQYNNGQSRLPKAKVHRRVRNAQSKILNHIEFFKNLRKDKANDKMFTKEPEIRYKEAPGNYNYDKNLDSTYAHGEDVALRRRHNSKQATITSDKMPSSIAD